MTEVYVPYCKNKMASEDLLTSHRTYLCVSILNERGSLFLTGVIVPVLFINIQMSLVVFCVHN